MASQKTDKKIVTLEQWAQITVEHGKTVIKLYPSNEEMLKRLKRWTHRRIWCTGG